MSEEKVVQLGSKKSKKHEKAQEKHEHNYNENQNEPVYCSFCGRPNTQVLKMVQGPGVNICSECVIIATQYLILNDRALSAEAQMLLDALWRTKK